MSAIGHESEGAGVCGRSKVDNKILFNMIDQVIIIYSCNTIYFYYPKV